MPRTTEKDIASTGMSKTPKKYSHQFFNTNIHEHRRIVARAIPGIEPADVDCVEELISLGSVELLTRRFIPREGTQEKYPTLFYFDGTAWVADGDKFSKAISSIICEKSAYQVIEMHTLLAPEHSVLKSKQYAYRLFQHFYERAETYQIDRGAMSIAGYSSGGNIADYIDTRASRTEIRFTQKILISPFIELSGTVPDDKKYRQYAKFAGRDDQISAEFIRYFLNLAVPEADRRKPSISPLWQKKRLAKETFTRIILGENDRLRPQIEAFDDKLRSQGVDVEKFLVLEGTHAMFWRRLEVIHLVAKLLNSPKTADSHEVQLDETTKTYEIIRPTPLQH